MDASTAASLSAIAAGISTLAVIVTAVVAVYALRGSRQDSRERTRPVVVASLQREPLVHGTLNLVLRNYGASAARNLHVHFDPPLPDPSSLPDSDMRKWIAHRYARPVAIFPPATSLSNVYRAGYDDVAPLTVKVAYTSGEGRTYHDHFELNPDVLMKGSEATPGDSTPDAKRLVRAIEALVRATDRRS